MIDWDNVRRQVKINSMEIGDMIQGALGKFTENPDLVLDDADRALNQFQSQICERMITILKPLESTLPEEFAIKWISNCIEQADLDDEVPYEGFSCMYIDDLVELVKAVDTNCIYLTPDQFAMLLSSRR